MLGNVKSVAIFPIHQLAIKIGRQLKMCDRFVCVAIKTWLAVGSTFALCATPVSLLEAYNLARQADPLLSIAKYNVEGAEAQRDVARGQLLPQVAIFGNWSDNRIEYDGAASVIPTQNYPGERYGVQLRQPILNVAKLIEWKRQASVVSQSEAELEIAEMELLVRVTQAYLEVLILEETLQSMESESESLTAQAEQADALLQVSLVPLTQLLEAKSRLASVNADVVGARGDLGLARERLSQLTGLDDIQLRQVKDNVSLLTEMESIETAAALAVSESPEVEVAEHSLQAARQAISREKGSWVPELELIVSHQYSDVGFDNASSPPRATDTISLNLTYPIIQGGSGAARRRAAWAEFYGAQSVLTSTVRDIEANARAAWFNMEVAGEREVASRRVLESTELSLAATTEAARLGTVRLTDVLIALASNTSAKRELVNARFQRVLYWLQLGLVTGSQPAQLVGDLSSSLHGGD